MVGSEVGVCCREEQKRHGGHLPDARAKAEWPNHVLASQLTEPLSQLNMGIIWKY